MNVSIDDVIVFDSRNALKKKLNVQIRRSGH